MRGLHPACRALKTVSVDVSPRRCFGVVLSLWCVSVGRCRWVQSTQTTDVPDCFPS